MCPGFGGVALLGFRPRVGWNVTPKSSRGWVKALLHSVYDQPDADAGHHRTGTRSTIKPRTGPESGPGLTHQTLPGQLTDTGYTGWYDQHRVREPRPADITDPNSGSPTCTGDDTTPGTNRPFSPLTKTRDKPIHHSPGLGFTQIGLQQNSIHRNVTCAIAHRSAHRVPGHGLLHNCRPQLPNDCPVGQPATALDALLRPGQRRRWRCR